MSNTPAFETSTQSSTTQMRSFSLISRGIVQWFKQEQSQFAFKVFARASAALLAGYVAAATLACLLTLVLPMPRFESTITANMLAFLFYAIAIIYAFCVRKTWHAWRDLGLVSLLCFGLIKVCGQ
ncbi:DUF3649 domain-containing protein [Shewanella sp. SW36]|jgi:uncharacterized membrane protein|uniref:DUF3649 domain-containing protein n=1 Tax=Shewanella oncorhynchi TaxID=2726434 RepID=A0AA50Q5J0_9GAMM|nr:MULTISPECIES: DUF3649 domain-containing protein [Shewanella]MBP8118738.1 DUF3649 domain-containing protein [Shewanella sp.]GCF88084.1 siderophore transporter component 1 [Shewanella sp. M-Br]MBI1673478.1 DUF3649 domain-containing protein [Shewanella sp. DW31]MBW3514353.1 DUF3649 domain-containing protein [Shewanella sp. NKUCC01_JLK]MCU7963102.1 DUF3649 domain-containing protein [Shewanella sp. SW32]